MAARLDGKVALVTGGGSGIGRAACLAFARDGARVVIADVDVEGGLETASQIETTGGQAIFVRADVTRANEVEALVARAVEAYGRLDCAFNNAGVVRGGQPIPDLPEEDWRRTLDVNLTGVFLSMKYEIPQMLKQGGGSIVNTSSVYGLVGGRGDPAYVASKHGVIGLTKVAALQWSQLGIRVNAVCPGWTHTPMSEGFLANPETLAAVLAMHPIGRVARPEEIAEAVVWLCSDAASFVTGHAMPVDGGYVAQ